ncbi:MFS transporter [Bacillus sp. MMSF_3353]|uniref:MFS transporter n=1 Tax=Bacillus sp. MMSF_3353 TaxID=3047081 RepID=UPI00273E5093|nr:MFS transporter [Bacillus sp. MMSF_3353]
MKRVLAVFFTIMFMIGTDTFLISPLLPTLQKVYHVSTELSGWMVSSYALGYAAFSFFGVWLSIQFGLQVHEVGTTMLILGLGNLAGNIFGPRITNKIGYNLSFYGGIIFTAVLYVLLPHVKNIILVELLFFVLFFVTGILFVLMMRHLQNISSVARGTGAALANASMYIGQMIGAAIAGLLFAASHNFILIGSFTALLYIGALFLFRKSEKLNEDSETGIVS